MAGKILALSPMKGRVEVVEPHRGILGRHKTNQASQVEVLMSSSSNSPSLDNDDMFSVDDLSTKSLSRKYIGPGDESQLHSEVSNGQIRRDHSLGVHSGSPRESALVGQVKPLIQRRLGAFDGFKN